MNDAESQCVGAENLRLIIRDETNKLLLSHLQLCPFVSNKVEERTRKLETKTATMIGYMIGSGALGGMSGALVNQLMG